MAPCSAEVLEGSHEVSIRVPYYDIRQNPILLGQDAYITLNRLESSAARLGHADLFATESGF